MKNVETQKWLEANKICLVGGDSAALNLMFETKKDHERFLKYWDKYLGGMTEIINYHLSPTGWTILFKTKSEITIKNAYLLQRKKSKKAKSKNVLLDIGKILSEHFRIFLSQYVRRTNASHRRSGTLVKQSFSKYILNHWENYREIFDRIVTQKKRAHQLLEKYQADEESYDKKGEMESDSIWKVGTRYYLGLEKTLMGLKKLYLIPPNSYILRKYLTNSLYAKISPPFT